MSPYHSSLLVTPNHHNNEYMHVDPESAGWEHLSFAACKLPQGSSFDWDTGENELALVILGGKCSVRSNRGNWEEIGRRANVFSGMPYTLYLPRQTRFTVESLSPELDVAYGWCLAHSDHPARLVRPEDVAIEIRGGDNVTRQINKMIPPGFDCGRLVVVEVYTPSGNWSSYPPHKHDQHRVDEGVVEDIFVVGGESGDAQALGQGLGLADIHIADHGDFRFRDVIGDGFAMDVADAPRADDTDLQFFHGERLPSKIVFMGWEPRTN